MVVLAAHRIFQVPTEVDPATFLNGKFNDGKAINNQIHVFWLGLGTKESESFSRFCRGFSKDDGKTGN